MFFFIRTQLPPPTSQAPPAHHHPFAFSPFCSVTPCRLPECWPTLLAWPCVGNHSWASACVQRPHHVQKTAFQGCTLRHPVPLKFPSHFCNVPRALEGRLHRHRFLGQLLDNHLFSVLDQLWVFTLTRDHSLSGSRLRTALIAVYEHKPSEGSLAAYPFTKRRVILP